MIARHFKLLCYLSAVMCLTIGAIWIRSYWYGDSISFTNQGRMVALNTEKGCLWVYSLLEGNQSPMPWTTGWSIDSGETVPWTDSMFLYIAPLDEGDAPQVLASEYSGLHIFNAQEHWPLSMDGETGWFARIPLWMVLLPCSVPLLLALKRRFGQRGIRIRLGLCEHCGYDQQGTMGATCPECGVTKTHRACSP